ncbi:hypothetical protein R3Q06_29350 [Rhodococcus erythropolis]|uniref:hypothetical protein n=1 Tax=Rhodococcus erythropolis TaxID=1833 RepID=UPI002948D0E8|nr:hypothetical protein [Rhodococcus erythropolis]MDV6277602.1 hypothetical protein [Rhodococcus erythropolis]
MAEHLATRTNRMTWQRKLFYIPLAVGVIAGAAGAGTGIGMAATDAATDVTNASTSAPDTALESGDPGMDWWSLYNNTGQPIFGTWSEQSGSLTKELDLVKDMPLANGGHESRERTDSMWRGDPYWMGHICYAHAWWNFPRSVLNLGPNARFALEAKDGQLRATWNPQATPSRSGTDLTRNPYEAPC